MKKSGGRGAFPASCFNVDINMTGIFRLPMLYYLCMQI